MVRIGLASKGWLTILDTTIRFLARAKGKGLLGRVGSDLDGIDVNSASDAWLKAVFITCIHDLVAWACAENEVVRLDLLRHSGQINEVQGLQKKKHTQVMIG